MFDVGQVLQIHERSGRYPIMFSCFDLKRFVVYGGDFSFACRAVSVGLDSLPLYALIREIE